MEAPSYLPRALGRAMAWAVAMAIAMASSSAAEGGPPTFASPYQSTWIQPANSVSGTTPSRAPLRRLSADDNEVDNDVIRFTLVDEAAYYEPDTGSCGNIYPAICFQSGPPHTDNCAAKINILPPGCHFKFYYSANWETPKPMNGTDLRVPHKAPPSTEGLEFLHADLSFLETMGSGTVYNTVTNADMKGCPVDYSGILTRVNGDIPKENFVLRVTTAPPADIHVGTIDCIGKFPNVTRIGLDSSFSGIRPVPAKSADTLRAENLQSESRLIDLKYQCGGSIRECPDEIDLHTRIKNCLNLDTEESPCVGGNFIGRLHVEKLKNRCNPSAERLVYRMPESLSEALKALNTSASQSGSGSEATFNFRLESIYFRKNGEKLDCSSQPILFELHEGSPENATQSCGESLPEPLSTATAISKDDGLQIANPNIGSFPFSKSSLVITDLCDFHNRTEVQVNFTLQFNVTFPTPTPTTTTTTTTATTTTTTATTTTTTETEESGENKRKEDETDDDKLGAGGGGSDTKNGQVVDYGIGSVVDDEEDDDEEDNYDESEFVLVEEWAYIRSTNSSCGSSGITNCSEADTVLEGCTKTVNELPLACRPFKLYHLEKLDSYLSLVNRSNFVVKRQADFTLAPVEGLNFLYTDISFHYFEDGVEKNITVADVDKCEKKPQLGERKDATYVLRSTTLPKSEINLGEYRCGLGFPNVHDFLVETVFEGKGQEQGNPGLGGDTNNVQDGGHSNDSGKISGDDSRASSTTVQVDALEKGGGGQGSGTNSGPAGEDGVGETTPPPVKVVPEKPAPAIATKPPKAPAPAPVEESSTAAASPLKGALSVASGLSLGLIVLLTMGVTR